MYKYLHICVNSVLCICEIDKQRRKKMIGVKVLNLLEPIGPIVGIVNLTLSVWAIETILKTVGLA